MKLKRVIIVLCEACLNGEGEECHTPGCAMYIHDSPGFPIAPELYAVTDEWDSEDADAVLGEIEQSQVPQLLAEEAESEVRQ